MENVKTKCVQKVFIHLIMKFLYEEAELYLPRKYNKFLEFEIAKINI